MVRHLHDIFRKALTSQNIYIRHCLFLITFVEQQYIEKPFIDKHEEKRKGPLFREVYNLLSPIIL